MREDVVRKLYFFVSLFLAISFSLSADQERKLAQEQLSSFIEHMGQEYCLDCGMYNLPNDTEEFSATFIAYQHATLEEARAMVVMLTERFLNEINSNEKIRPFLKEYPYPPGRVEMHVQFYNLAMTPQCDGNIFQAFHLGGTHEDEGVLIYDSGQVFSYEQAEVHEETYKEAAEIVRTHGASYQHEWTDYEKLLDLVFMALAGHMYEKYKCTCEKIGAKASAPLEKIEAIYTVFHRVNQKKARKIQVDAVETLLTLINECEPLRPYLKEYPFTAKNLKIRLDFREHRSLGVGWASYRDGSMGSVLLENSQLTYTRVNGTRRTYDPEFLVGVEPYEHALKKAGKSYTK